MNWHGNISYSVRGKVKEIDKELLIRGFARVNTKTVNRNTRLALLEIQNKAKCQRTGIWSTGVLQVFNVFSRKMFHLRTMYNVIINVVVPLVAHKKN